MREISINYYKTLVYEAMNVLLLKTIFKYFKKFKSGL